MSLPIIGSNAFQTALTYRLVGPAVVADASGGTVQVNANSKFNTNLPIDRFMLITKIFYFLTWTKTTAPALVYTDLGSWNIFAQLTEALARTVPVTTDPVFIDEWTLFQKGGVNATVAAGVGPSIPFPGLVERPLYNPWATAAQQLNQIVAVQPNNSAQAGPNVSIAPVLEYQLLPLTADIRGYLAQRIQIAGQA